MVGPCRRLDVWCRGPWRPNPGLCFSGADGDPVRWKIVWKELIKEYKTSNLFILPSRTEWFWITIIEALVSKVPVISTKCWWPEDIIKDWINWFLIEKENSEELKNIIIKFITWKIIDLENIKQNWYDTVKNNYTWDIISDKIYNEYIKIRWSL